MIELSDNEYRESLKDMFLELIREYEISEEYELCSRCQVMINEIPEQPIESIKDFYNKIKVLKAIKDYPNKFEDE